MSTMHMSVNFFITGIEFTEADILARLPSSCVAEIGLAVSNGIQKFYTHASKKYLLRY